VDADQLLVELRGVALSTGSACSSATPAPSHVLTALGLPAARVRASVRMGLGRFTTREEVDAAGDQLVACVEKLRGGAPRKPAPTPLPSAGSKS
jgi:cysteine desulfurase